MRILGLHSIGVAILQFVLPSVTCNSPTASTVNGTYYGTHNSHYNVDAFLGIPYAQPPLKSLRYQVPQPSNISWTGLKSATEFGNQCIGYGSDTYMTPVPLAEDCLSLNVVRPSGYYNVSLPIGVWIHGGGYTEGSNSNPRYNLSFIVQSSVEAETPIIAIGINYRLQAWGFLFSEEIRSEKVANLGLRDQRAALAWIQENIAGFGGDPSKVTIWGESAGAGSVGSQLVAFNGRNDGLFRAAIAESGSSISWSRYAPPATYQALYDNITFATGCGNVSDTLDCLRDVPVETLNNVFNSTVVTSAGLQYPVIDGDFIVQSPTTQLRNGEFVKVPFIIGCNTDEGASFVPQTINTDAEFRTYLKRYTTDNTTLDILEILYPDVPAIGIPATLHSRPDAAPAGVGSQFKRAAALNGDTLMHAPRRFTNEIWAANNISSYSYRFNTVPNGIAWTCGSCHFKEVAFVMNNIDGVGYEELGGINPFAGETAAYTELARMMSRMWASFIYSTDPNDSEVTDTTWPVYGVTNGQNYVFDVNVTALSYVEADIFRAESIKYIKDNFVDLFGR